MILIAHTVKGLENIAANELQSKIKDLQIDTVETKNIYFKTKNLIQLRNLRCIDDISLLITKKIFGTKPTHKEILAVIKKTDFKHAIKTIGELRDLSQTFGITASRFKNDRIDRDLLSSELIKPLEEMTGMKYKDQEHNNFDVRIKIEENILLVSVKLFEQSLFMRENKFKSQLGAIRTTIAGAMVFDTIHEKRNAKVVDNLCGSGTILYEAFIQGHTIYGGDISTKSVEITKFNLESLEKGLAINIKQLDASRTPWPDHFFDAAISNLPWGKQIRPGQLYRLYINVIKEYSRILKPTGTLCLIGTYRSLMEDQVSKYFPNHEIFINEIGYLGQHPYIVEALPKEKFTSEFNY